MDEFIGIIKLFAGPYAPQGWAVCDGSLLNINQNQALFNIIGTTYGGDGQATFALPDLRSRVPVGAATSGSLPADHTRYEMGDASGRERVALTANNLPAHTHALHVSSKPATMAAPAAGAALAQPGQKVGLSFTPSLGYSTNTPDTALHQQSVETTGKGEPVDVRPPMLALNYIICLYGLYPSRS